MLLSKKLFLSFFPQFKNISETNFENMLNSIGVEIENIFKFEKIEGLIVGKIIDIEIHPKSQKLNICKVLFLNKIHQIICGAHNVQKNKKVIIAQIGTKMPDGRFIEKKKILDIESSGMICGYKELNNITNFISNNENDQIIILDDNAKLNNKNPLNYIGLDDTILDLSIPSNRNELNGIIGLGYDLLSVLNNKNKFDYNIFFKNIKKLNLNFRNNNNCNFFSLIKIDNPFIKKESSWKIKYYLMNSGIAPKNPIVDISNLIMIISGNPSNCFKTLLVNNELSIENNINTKITGLDNKDYKIIENDICITTNNKIISLAGIIGISEFSINNREDEIFFEIANFNNFNIQKTNNRLNINTQSATLFSKKIPIWISLKALEILIILLKSMGFNIKGIFYTKVQFKKNKIIFEYERIKKLLGINISFNKVVTILSSFGFTFTKDYKYLISPKHREDIENINDVTEEILKKININNLKPIEISSTNAKINFNSDYNNISFIKKYFINKGFLLLKTYNLTSIDKNNRFNIFSSKSNLEILNPISKDKIVIRNNIFEKHLDILKRNISYKNNLYNTFEIQKIYINGKWEYYLSSLISLDIFNNSLNKSKVIKDIISLKSIIKDLFANFEEEVDFKLLTKDFDFLYKNNSLEIWSNNIYIGLLGQFNNKKIREYDIQNSLYFIEININNLILKNKFSKFTVKEISNKHYIERDLSIIIKNNEFSKLENFIRKITYILSFDIQSLYKIDDNFVSYNIKFVFNIENTNLSISEINNVFFDLIKKLETNNFKIRKSN